VEGGRESATEGVEKGIGDNLQLRVGAAMYIKWLKQSLKGRERRHVSDELTNDRDVKKEEGGRGGEGVYQP